jgi:hypothetical protein
MPTASYIIGDGTGDTNISVLKFYDSDESTLRGQVGDAVVGDDDIYLWSETGDVRLHVQGVTRLKATPSGVMVIAAGNYFGCVYGTAGSGTDVEGFRIGTHAGSANETGVIKWDNNATAGNRYLGIFTWGDANPIRIGGSAATFQKEDNTYIPITVASIGAGADGADLGDGSNRFDVFARDATLYREGTHDVIDDGTKTTSFTVNGSGGNIHKAVINAASITMSVNLDAGVPLVVSLKINSTYNSTLAIDASGDSISWGDAGTPVYVGNGTVSNFYFLKVSGTVVYAHLLSYAATAW